jgi:hypothetical protein
MAVDNTRASEGQYFCFDDNVNTDFRSAQRWRNHLPKYFCLKSTGPIADQFDDDMCAAVADAWLAERQCEMHAWRA